MVKRQPLLVQVLFTTALVLLLRLPFLNEAVQGDDVYYLYGAQHAQIDPLHPLHTHYAFLGEMVDMRGHPHGPLNSWVLGALVSIFGEVREVPFHTAYIAFSLAAALAMLALARRFAPDHTMGAVVLFCVFPAFVVNGNSFEADLPFLAFWLISLVYGIKAIDTRNIWLLMVSMIAGAIAALDAYQAVMLTPILGLYLWQRDRKWLAAWPAIFAAPFTIILWQAWEWSGSGVLPTAVLLGYMKSGSLQSASNKWASAVTLTGHLAWLILPALAFKAVLPRKDFLRCHFLQAWIWIFFAASLVIFFAGSARYLLPLYAPLAIVIANSVSRTRLMAAIGIHAVVSLGLATANHQQWGATRDFANRVMDQAGNHRVWANAEFGLRHYLEDRGALPLLRDTLLREGDIVVTSDLAQPVTVNAPLARLMETTISPSVPLRLISIDGGSGYSSASKGMLPFEISTEIVDRLHADTVTERKPELSYLDPKDPKAAAHVFQGLSPDGWMSGEASILLKIPDPLHALGVTFFIPPDAPARTMTLLADGKVIAEDTFPKPGAYSLSAPFKTTAKQMTVGLRVDKTHTVPPDNRALGVVITSVGFK
jgi:hypothetical protein